MVTDMARRVRLITYIAAYIFAFGVALRYFFSFRDQDLLFVGLLLVVYFVLLVIEPFLTRRHRALAFFYFIVQVAIISGIALLIPVVDYWAGLFFPLLVQVMNSFPGRTGYIITGAFTVTMAILMLMGLGAATGLPIIISNGIAFFLIAAFSNLLHEAEEARQDAEARKESQQQQVELEAAHRQLQSYTTQAEELAVMQERNRMARNLHDSVTQTIFSMRLTAEAANILLEQDPARVRAELDKMQILAKSALAEIRSLVFELRPTAVSELGLIPALRHHIMTLERQHGLKVDLQLSGEPQLPEVEARGLFRISQEALNNVIKYAQTDKAWLTLQFEGNRAFLQVEDRGVGFDPHALTANNDHIGLTSMEERVDGMGGVLTIDSHPGQGTRVTVEVNSAIEEKSDGQD